MILKVRPGSWSDQRCGVPGVGASGCLLPCILPIAEEFTYGIYAHVTPVPVPASVCVPLSRHVLTVTTVIDLD